MFTGPFTSDIQFIRGVSTLLEKGLSAAAHSFQRTGLHLPAQQIEHGHTDGQAIGDLLQDGGVRPVGHFGGDLDAAIDGPGR